MPNIADLREWEEQPQDVVEVSSRDGFYFASIAGHKYQAGGLLPGISASSQVNSHSRAGRLTLGSSQTVTPSIVAVPSGSWSIILDFSPVSRVSIYPYFLGISGAANAFALAWRHDSFAGRAVWYPGGSVAHDSGLTFPIGEPAVLGLTFNSVSTTYTFYKNGIPGLSFVAASTGSGNWQFASATNEGNVVDINLLAFSSIAIPQSRMMELTASPYKIFEPEEVITFFPAAGNISVLPAAAISRALGLPPTIRLGSMSYIPSPTIAKAAAIQPLVRLGSLAVAPAAAIAKALAQIGAIHLGPLTIIPAFVAAKAAAIAGSVLGGSGLIVTAAAAVARALTIDPVVRLGSLLIIPVAVAARTGAILLQVLGGLGGITSGFFLSLRRRRRKPPK